MNLPRQKLLGLIAGLAIAGLHAEPAKANALTVPWQAVDQIQRYGATSFRNAGMPASELPDSTQQLIVEMLRRCPSRNWSQAVSGEAEASHRELNRAVWRIVKRWKRQRTPQSLEGNAAARNLVVGDRRRRGLTLEDLQSLPGADLSDRQAKILHLLCQGYSHKEIAAELRLDHPQQVSHEKYRAVQKLRRAWMRSESV